MCPNLEEGDQRFRRVVFGVSLTWEPERICVRSPPLVKLALLLAKLTKGGGKNHVNVPKVVAVPLVVLEVADDLPRC